MLEITQSDCLNLPVFVCTYPKGQTACTFLGKGLHPEDASISALMEAVEYGIAEQAAEQGAYVRLGLVELAERLPGDLSLGDFAPRLDADPQADRPTLAVRCVDLLSGFRALLPAELVMVPAPDEDHPPLFGWSSNGLAAGSTLNEATLHALLEVLERDAIAMSMVRGDATFVDLHTLPEPWLSRSRQWQAMGIHLHVRHLPSDFGLPCFEATFHEPDGRQVELARGWGIHFDSEAALTRAICEAAQSRLCKIHSEQPGMAELYGARISGDTTGAVRGKAQFMNDLAQREHLLDFRQVRSLPVEGVDEALKDLLARLQARDFRHVFRRRMGHEAGVHVVKVIVPGCENILGNSRRAGPRLMAAAAALA